MPLLDFKVVLFFISLFAAAIFAFLETAFTSLRLFKIKELARSTSRFRKLFDTWEHNPRHILISILVASNLADVLTSVLITDITQAILGDTGFSLIIGVFTATVLILIFGEIIPKSFAKTHPDSLLGPALWFINALFYLLRPLSCLLLKCTDFFVRKFSKSEIEEKGDIVSEKEIEFLITYGDEKGLIEAEKSEMLQNIFGLGATFAKEIMVPATDVLAINIKDSLEKAMKLFIKYKFTRLPVYQDRDDNFVGMIHQKDVFELLYQEKKKPLGELIMPIVFIPETIRLNQLLREFLRKRLHMAVVVNEHGEVTGIITLEDILEEIVGEIVDEHEKVHQEVVPLDEGGWIVEGRTELKKLNDLLNINFSVEESITLGGFLAERLQHLPKKGERVFYKGYCFQVQRASSTRVNQVLIFEDKGEG
ncbi:HlyC/CorC family transporter [Candidatus Babeliales bacterium]|nr:HlyC/CorC family transporter [Candidatus Babeliales bacterium]